MFCARQVSYSSTVNPAALLADQTNHLTHADENQFVYTVCLKTKQKLTPWQNRNRFVRNAGKQRTARNA